MGEFVVACLWNLQSRDQKLSLEDEFLRKLAVELEEEFILHDEFAMPLDLVDLLDFVELLHGHGTF